MRVLLSTFRPLGKETSLEVVAWGGFSPQWWTSLHGFYVRVPHHRFLLEARLPLVLVFGLGVLYTPKGPPKSISPSPNKPNVSPLSFYDCFTYLFSSDPKWVVWIGGFGI